MAASAGLASADVTGMKPARGERAVSFESVAGSKDRRRTHSSAEIDSNTRGVVRENTVLHAVELDVPIHAQREDSRVAVGRGRHCMHLDEQLVVYARS